MDYMRLDTDQTPGSDHQPGRTRTILGWWNSRSVLHRDRRRLFWISATVTLLALAATVLATSLWNYYGLSPPVTTPSSDITAMVEVDISFDPVEQIASALWEVDLGQPLSAPAASADGETYIVLGNTPDTGAITSLKAPDGAPLWTVKLDSISDYSPVIAGEMLFVGTRAGDLMAFDRSTGTQVWTADLGSSVVGSPIIHAGVLHIASVSVYAFDAATGQQLWRHEVGGDVSRPIRLSNGIISAISSDGNVNLISAFNGRRRMTFPLWFSTSDAPVFSGNTLVIPGDRAYVQALDVSKRDVPMEKAIRYWWTKLWLWDMAPRPPLPRGYLWQNRTLNGDTSYALGTDDSSAFIGISREDGTGTIVALDLDTGEASWKVEAESRVLVPGVLANYSLIVGTEHSGVLVIDKQTGAVLWQFTEESELAAAPTATDEGLLLIPTADGLLKAVR